jgi:hypothetical protein
MNPLKLFDKLMSLSTEQADSLIKLSIAVTFCFTVVIMVGMSLYSVVFVEQPMGGMAPADKQFFLILSDMSKYILGSLATLLAVKGKDGIQKLLEPPGGFTKPEPDRPNPPFSTAPGTAMPHTVPRVEPSLAPITTPTPAPIATGYGGREAPIQPPHPEIN